MKPHKWAKEIHAWADGAKIQSRWNDKMSHVKHDWHDCDGLIDWDLPANDFRIKPQPKESEFAHIPYWLCCGSLDIRHHATSCSEAKVGYPERCRFGTVEEHQKRMEKPQPKEPQYLYVYKNADGLAVIFTEWQHESAYIGKIKLETDDGQ